MGQARKIGKAAAGQAAAESGAEELARLQAILPKAGINARQLRVLALAEGKPVMVLQADGAAAIALWGKLRELVERTGYWPVVMGDLRAWEAGELGTSKALEKIWTGFVKKRTGLAGRSGSVTALLLAAAEKMDVDGWIERRTANLAEYDREEGDEWSELAKKAGASLARVRVNREYRAVYEVLTKKPIKGISVGLWPARKGWQVPAMMRFGGWNACPQPFEHAAMLRRWKKKYDAELVVAAGDVVEMRVGKPPKTDAAARALAREQYAFCDDIVSQGTMSLARLAGALKGAPVWYFWWD